MVGACQEPQDPEITQGKKNKKKGNVNPTPSHVHLSLAKLFRNNLQGTSYQAREPPDPYSYSTPTPLHVIDALTSTETVCQGSGREGNKNPAHSKNKRPHAAQPSRPAVTWSRTRGYPRGKTPGGPGSHARLLALGSPASLAPACKYLKGGGAPQLSRGGPRN